MSDRARRGLAVFGTSLTAMARSGAGADRAGFDSVWTSELYNRSATVTLAALAGTTEDCAIGSGILYGVGRSPLMLAAEARDLDELSSGRFVLGLGNGTRKMIADWHGLDGDGAGRPDGGARAARAPRSGACTRGRSTTAAASTA